MGLLLLVLQVMQGRIQVRTRSQFKAALDVEATGSSGGQGQQQGGGGADTSNGGASDADLRALFDSIDVDGSGERACGMRRGTTLHPHATALERRPL